MLDSIKIKQILILKHTPQYFTLFSPLKPYFKYLNA